MSWAAHELESIILHRHADRPGTMWRISYMAILIGALMPDFTKLPVYGLHIGRWEVMKAPEPWMYHRGWPGSGPTHSLVAGILAASLVYVITRNKPWGIGVLVGYWSHVLTDTADSVGTMLFFPFATQHYSFGMWQYASQEGRYGDAAAYFSSLGWAWDVLWIVLVLLLARKALTAEYFHTNVEPADPFWGILEHRFHAPDHVRRAVFRAYIVYGAARVASWFLWARLLNPKRGDVEMMDLSWTGPGWVQAPPRFQVASTWSGFAVATTVGLAGTALTAYVAWRTVKRLPERSAEAVPATRGPACATRASATCRAEVLPGGTRFTAQPELSIPNDGSVGPPSRRAQCVRRCALPGRRRPRADPWRVGSQRRRRRSPTPTPDLMFSRYPRRRQPSLREADTNPDRSE